jgi:serine protease Do
MTSRVFGSTLAAVFLAAVLSLGFAPPAAAQRAGLPDFTDLYEKYSPAVVSIDVTQKMRRPRTPELSEDDPFYEFFRRFGQVPNPRGGGRGGPDRELETQSVGSGFILSSDGYLITNAHVVEGADEVTVRLSDRREYKAKVIGADKRTDVAPVVNASHSPSQ